MYLYVESNIGNYLVVEVVGERGGACLVNAFDHRVYDEGRVLRRLV